MWFNAIDWNVVRPFTSVAQFVVKLQSMVEQLKQIRESREIDKHVSMAPGVITVNLLPICFNQFWLDQNNFLPT